MSVEQNTSILLKRSKTLDTRLKDNLRRRLSKTLKGAPRVAKAHELLGCKLPHFKKHLEAQFTEGMNWDNYGTLWAVDHILPLMNFDMSKGYNQRRLFHHKNLRPLTNDENRKRKKKL